MKALIMWVAGIVAGTASFIGGFFVHQPQVPPPSLEVATTTSTTTNVSSQKSSDLLSGTQPMPAGQTSAQTHSSSSTSVELRGSGVDLTKLPLGDGKYTTTGAKKGYIYVCHVASGGGGAQIDGSWIHGSTWDETQKIAVQGSVAWPTAYFRTAVANAVRTLVGNGLPVNHTTGIFPIQSSDPAYQVDRNPNSISAQTISYSLPENPSIAATPGCIYGQVGIMTDGVALFDGFDAEYRDAVAHEVQDSCDGHPERTGEYHYHGLSPCLKNATATTVIGWAFDGFPITGPYLSNGTELSTADLDECHGMTSDVVVDGVSKSTYHYVMTRDFPYSVGCFKGTSHEPKPSGTGQTQPGGQGGMPQSMMPPPPRY